MPSHLISKAQLSSSRGSSPGVASIGAQSLGHRLAARVLGRVHAVDHPVLAARSGTARSGPEPLAVEGDDHLVVAELLGLVGAGVPDLHRAGAVLALRDVAREVEVLERVVLDVDREVVVASGRGDALRDGPGDSTPSRSSRRSQCRLRAWCSWTTKRGARRRRPPLPFPLPARAPECGPDPAFRDRGVACPPFGLRYWPPFGRNASPRDSPGLDSRASVDIG